tara:strand:+ start:21361 stop:22014 length:654 start_codon:yes stop_codon:yes gene_type:complete
MITAIIPVRKGSVRVKNKNIKPFANSSLLEIKIKQLLNLKKWNRIDDIIVSSDSEEMLEIAKSLNVRIHNRKKHFASSEADNSDFFKNIGEDVGSSDWIMYSPVTCPLLSFETYNEILIKFEESPHNTVTVSPIKHHLWLDGKPLNYEISKSPNSQDLPDIYSINYAVSIIKRKDMIKFKNIVTNNPKFIVLDEIESIDIDTELDFEFAEFVYKKLN